MNQDIAVGEGAIDMRLVAASASQATLAFDRIGPTSEPTGGAVNATLRGPFCARAKTLPGDFAVIDGRAVVFEPCYWTTELPFLYQLLLGASPSANEAPKQTHSLGLRGMYARRRDFIVEGKRIVLRGGRMESLDASQLAEAREAEAAVIVVNPTTELCVEASRIGVAILADLRTLGDEWRRRALQLSWTPAAALVLVSGVQLNGAAAQGVAQPFDMPIALVIDAAATAESLHAEADAVLIELRECERPPQWLANSAKPVLGWRRQASVHSLFEKRVECDRLQADLAPEFDLAGYFV